MIHTGQKRRRPVKKTMTIQQKSTNKREDKQSKKCQTCKTRKSRICSENIQRKDYGRHRLFVLLL